MSYEDFGVGILKVSYDILGEFFRNKPCTLDVIGIADSRDPNHGYACLTVKGPEIPTTPGPDGIPEVECVVVRLEDGSLEWNFTAK